MAQFFALLRMDARCLILGTRSTHHRASNIEHPSSRQLTCVFAIWVALNIGIPCVRGQNNWVNNPGFETKGDGDFAAAWGSGAFGELGKTVFLETTGTHSGQNCVRMVGTPNTWTTCAAESIPVKPETTYWITWWFKGNQPLSSRTYLFLQTNLAQRVFPQTDRRGDFDWTLNIVPYRTKPVETWLSPVLTMQTSQNETGISWWDDIGVWSELPPDFQAIYRREHPWDDAISSTACRLAQTASCIIWGDRPEVRIYPTTPVPQDAPDSDRVLLTAPGNGHDVYQLVVTPKAEMGPVSLSISSPKGPDKMPLGSVSYKVVRCVPVKEARDASFPLGVTPDPLVEPIEPVSIHPGQSALFWIEWSPPVGTKVGAYSARVQVLSGGRPIAAIPLVLRRWGFDLPEEPRYRSMVVVGGHEIRRFYPDISEEQALRLAWGLLSRHRLSAFNLALWPTPKLEDGKLLIDWTRFDKIVAAAKQYRASALTLGPMFGGGCSEGWKPRFKFVGFEPLADPGFDAPYAEFNRQVAHRLRQAGLLDKAYVYPYDEPEPDYMDKVARLCDLIHEGDPDLKCLTTTDPATGRPLWGKVNAWIIPSSVLQADLISQRRAARDEIWIYNMTAAIEDSPLEHRLYSWRALRVDAVGGLLWNANWWHRINPWENPTAAPVPVGRNLESLYRYQAGQASLFYPDPEGKGPLIPALRLLLIRQGVEDFDLLTELATAWRSVVPYLSSKAKTENVIAKARAAFIGPIMLDPWTTTRSVARTEAVRLILGNELEAMRERPAMIVYPTRVGASLAVEGTIEVGARLTLDGKPVLVDGDGHFQAMVSEEQLAEGLRWKATKGFSRKKWVWPGLR